MRTWVLFFGGLVLSFLLAPTHANAYHWWQDQHTFQPPMMAPQPYEPFDARPYRRPSTGWTYRREPTMSRTYGGGNIVVRVSNSAQRMHVYVNGALAYSWPVSTARKGYRTPAGSYRVQRMHRMWYSRKYDMSPMPHALFFRGGYAIHGTYSIRALGRPASHGCIRLHPGNARTLYSLVASSGGARVVVTP